MVYNPAPALSTSTDIVNSQNIYNMKKESKANVCKYILGGLGVVALGAIVVWIIIEFWWLILLPSWGAAALAAGAKS